MQPLEHSALYAWRQRRSETTAGVESTMARRVVVWPPDEATAPHSAAAWLAALPPHATGVRVVLLGNSSQALSCGAA